MSNRSVWVLLLLINGMACSEVEQDKNTEGVTLNPATAKQAVSRSGSIEVKVELDSPVGARNDIQLFFSGGFKNDDVIVRGGGRNLYHGVLTTDDRIAYAGEMKLSRKYPRVDFFVNGIVAQVEVPSGFRFCLLNRMQDTMILHFTNDEPRFR